MQKWEHARLEEFAEYSYLSKHLSASGYQAKRQEYLVTLNRRQQSGFACTQEEPADSYSAHCRKDQATRLLTNGKQHCTIHESTNQAIRLLQEEGWEMVGIQVNGYLTDRNTYWFRRHVP